MKRITAITLSVLFHPMLMPVIGLFFIFSSGTHLSFLPFEIKRLVYFIVFISSCILPLSLLPLLAQFKLIRSFKMESHRERIIPIFSNGLFIFLGYLVLQKFKLPLFIYQYLLATLISLNIALIITFAYKVSLHMTGIGGVVGAIVVLSLKFGLGISPIFILAILSAGVVASARLYLNAHTPLQILLGFFVGFCPILIIPFV